MNAKIVGFKGSRRGSYNNYCIIETDEKNLASLIGKKVIWHSKTGKTITGKILRTHGKRGLLARFAKGLPGHVIGSELEFRFPKKVKKIEKKAKVKKPAKKKIKKKPSMTKKVKKSKKPAKKKTTRKQKTPMTI
jgi:large subunit ribosomal protein L35Ae